MNEHKAAPTGTAHFHQSFVHQAPRATTWSLERAGQMADIRKACRIVLLITREMAQVAGDRVTLRAERRRSVSHFRQIAMYVCHVSLQLSLSEIGAAFGRDRTTVAYSCRVIEDRRDNREFDEFVASVERLAYSVVMVEVRENG
ncbi:helix-turn-helix domain-containing protein [Martelella mangrovi]|uniref:Chromosomal replication initiator DnaA C-terminal domain-containing protein n=1 Tax=Martelella mangrovi TaxID=1397477 RepID=A0ABV2I8H6_9HYPH